MAVEGLFLSFLVAVLILLRVFEGISELNPENHLRILNFGRLLRDVSEKILLAADS